jgi:hypothetical protein
MSDCAKSMHFSRRRNWSIRALISLVAGATGAIAADQWFDPPPRIVQTLWREPDVQDVDAAAVVRYLQETRANCVVLNGGGVIDFFRHEHALANPTSFLPKDRDVLGDVVAACHRAGIRVLARVDFRGVEEARLRRRPEWFARGPDGQPVIRESGLYHTCFNGGYRNEYGVYLIRQLLERHGVDGIWYNAVQSPGACYCAECERRYRDATGEAIPRVPDTQDAFLGAEMARYRSLKAQWALEHLGRVRDAIKAFGEDRVLSVEIFGMYAARPGAWGGVDVTTVAPVVDFSLGKAFVGDEGESGIAGSTIRFLQAIAPAKSAVLLTSTNRNRFRLIAENPVDARIALWDAVAAGGGIWNALVAGANPDAFADRRNARLAAPAFTFLAENGAALARQQPVAEAKILFSTDARVRFPEAFSAAMQGAERVLAEHHVPYSYVLDSQLEAAALARTNVLILAAAPMLPGRTADIVRAYVRGGGTLIADFQASLFDAEGARRTDFALADVFGVSFAGRVIEQTRNSPHRIRERHALIEGWHDTELLLNGGRMTLCRPGTAHVIASRVAPPTGAVPEQSWIREGKSEEPTIVVNTFGRGRSIYFAHEIMRQAWTDRHPDFGALLASAIELGRGDTPVLRTDAPRTVRLSLLGDARNGYTLSAVNHAESAARDVRVWLRLAAKKLHASRTLKSDGPVVVKTTADQIEIHFTRIEEFASVRLEVE